MAAVRDNHNRDNGSPSEHRRLQYRGFYPRFACVSRGTYGVSQKLSMTTSLRPDIYANRDYHEVIFPYTKLTIYKSWRPAAVM
jgi:hypothetical protein